MAKEKEAGEDEGRLRPAGQGRFPIRTPGVARWSKRCYNAWMKHEEQYHHRRLECGIEFAAQPIAGRGTVAYEIRVLAGLTAEPEDKLGLARLVDETLGKGTLKHTAQGLSDAFDAIGASCSSGVGRESFAFRCCCLPEYLLDALSLHAEMLQSPTFPEEFVRVAVDLGHQELTALEDEPGELARKFIAPHAYGPLLGRHELGMNETLDRISRDDIVSFWREQFAAVRIQVAVAGAVDVDLARDQIERLFVGFGRTDEDGRTACKVVFSPGVHHHGKDLEQEHVLICWPGAAVTSDDYPVERVVLGILSGGMSSRLFTEVREKQGLVYWVGAWDEHPRGAGMTFLGASTTPARCDQTVKVLLQELDRLAGDVTESELSRAKVGIIAKSQTRGDITRLRMAELSSDLFHYGRPVPLAEKNERVSLVTVDDIQRYLATYRRDKLCILTLGPRELKTAY
ncbi:MAG: pitrilysin family protein [Planctomycetota bacterium]